MTIELSKDTNARLVASIRRYFDEKFQQEIGDLKASMLLEFILAEVGPEIYNQAISDAQAYMQERVMDLEASLYEKDSGYWDD